jgi:SHS2 domain-containing protein
MDLGLNDGTVFNYDYDSFSPPEFLLDPVIVEVKNITTDEIINNSVVANVELVSDQEIVGTNERRRTYKINYGNVTSEFKEDLDDPVYINDTKNNVTVRLDRNIRVHKYTLTPTATPAEMPQNFRLLGSINGIDFTLLDERTGVV